MLARSSGLFSDYIESIELLIADGKDRFIWRESQDPEDTDLYFAVLGRSPDSFDLLIHGLQFIQPHSRLRLEWQQRNAEEALGGKTFSEEEPRMFWGIYGNKDLRARWPHYIDSREVRAPLRDQTARRAGGDLFAE